MTPRAWHLALGAAALLCGMEGYARSLGPTPPGFGECYYLRGKTVELRYLTDTGTGYKALPDADAATFRALSDPARPGWNLWSCALDPVWAVDRARVYYREQSVPDADPASFEVVWGHYARDGKHVFYKHQRVPGADPQTLRMLPRDWAVDRSRAYFRGRPIASIADPASLDVLDPPFVRDRKHVYLNQTPLPDVDPASFERVPVKGEPPWRLYRDSRRGYYIDLERARFSPQDAVHAVDADPRTFAELGELYYTRDATQVFFKGQRLEGAQADTFRVLKRGRPWTHWGSDGRHVYYGGTRLDGADAAAFQVLGRYYARDSRAVYYLGQVVEGADPQTFRIEIASERRGQDAGARYEGAVRVRP